MPEVDAGLRPAHRRSSSGGRTAQAYEDWRDDYLEQVAVAWVLACVFVRFMEDNDLIAETLPGRRRATAAGRPRTRTRLYFRAHPHDTDRDYLLDVFREVGTIPAAPTCSPRARRRSGPSAPRATAAMRLLAFWREIDPETAACCGRSQVEGGDTRFLGDLYQDLSEAARKKYALLQTPEFVEEFILDRTLTPALDEFGLEAVRLIDPTCGSGHFLLGAFRRLFRAVERSASRRPSRPCWPSGRSTRCTGVDINPFAVAIARFRLIVAGDARCAACGGWTRPPAGRSTSPSATACCTATPFDRRAGSASDGCRATSRGPTRSTPSRTRRAARDPRPAVSRRWSATRRTSRSRTRRSNERYRERWYDLPPAVLARRAVHRAVLRPGPRSRRTDDRPGYVGMITANSFMKREFGKKLIEEFFPKVDLTHVIDTSGAYIPGHGTPTVILFGRNRRPVGETVRAVLGIRGRADHARDPAQGLVWRSIVEHIDNGRCAETSSLSVADVPRATFAKHPWSIGGGGAAELKESIEDDADQHAWAIASMHWHHVCHTAKTMSFCRPSRIRRTASISADHCAARRR